MYEHIDALFIDNPELAEQIGSFCEKDPEYLEAKREFYETAHEIAKIVGFELYNRFERRMGTFMACSADVYYLFGLGLRQEVLDALQPEVS